MAAAVRLLPSIRPQMASLTPQLLIFQCALCGHHLEKESSGGEIGEEDGALLDGEGQATVG